MAIRIVTDSTCDILPEQLKQMGVTVLPLRLNFGEEELQDAVDITKKEFFDRLAVSDTLPKTSQANPGDFIEVIKPLLDSGDTVIGTFISSGISGSYQSALMAAKTLNCDRLHIVDSNTTTIGLGLIIRRIVAMRDSGATAAEICTEIEYMAKNIYIVAGIQTLKYLKLGGRISAATAVVGGVLGISPIIEMRGGVINTIDKTRGRKNVYEKIRKYLIETGYDDRYQMGFTHADAPQYVDELQQYFAEKGVKYDSFTDELGAVIGVHIGHGAIGIAFIKK